MSNQQAFPLSWPNGWPRTAAHKRAPAPFFTISRNYHASSTPGQSGYTTSSRNKRSMNTATEEIFRNLKLIGVGDFNVIVSTNVELRNDGLPYSNRKAPEDPGAAIFFKLKGKPCSLACDKWSRVEDNLYAISKHIEALRGQERWGVGSVEQAFAGYMALPPAGTSVGASWWNVLGCAHDSPFEAVKESYRAKAKIAHPDNGGSNDAMVTLNAAWDQARASFQR